MNKNQFVPTNCNSCGESLEWEGVDLVCNNSDCPAQSIKKIEFFIKTLGVMGISKPTLIKLDISSIEELYSLKIEDIKKLDGFGIKKATNMVNELKTKLHTTPERLLASFGISGFGIKMAKSILEVYRFDDVWNVNDFTHIEGIAQITSDKIVEGLKENRTTYEMLLGFGLYIEEPDVIEKDTESEFSGKILTLTGTAPLKRDDLVRILESNNCKVKNISKKVDFLVTNDVESNSSKAKKARSYGIPFMSYDELLDKLGVID